MKSIATYTVCRSPLSWHDQQAVLHAVPHGGCEHRHRTVEAAARCYRRLIRATRRYHGQSSYLDARVLRASSEDVYCELTDEETDRYYSEMTRSGTIR